VSQLEEQIAKARKEIAPDGYEMSIGEIINLYRAGELTINPEFQRLFRWESPQLSVRRQDETASRPTGKVSGPANLARRRFGPPSASYAAMLAMADNPKVRSRTEIERGPSMTTCVVVATPLSLRGASAKGGVRISRLL
jgi:hypothetical protein